MGLGADVGPSLAAVGRAVDAVVVLPARLRVLAVQGSHDQRARMLAVNAQSAVAARKAVRVLDRSDVGPDAVLGIEFPNRAVGRAARTGAIAIDHIQYALRIEAGMDGHEVRGLAGDRLPGLAGVGAAEEVAGPAIGRADVDRLRGLALGSGAGVEDDEAQSHARVLRARRRRPPAGPPARGGSAAAGREAVDLFPGQGRIIADPQPGRARAEIENVVVVGIDRQRSPTPRPFSFPPILKGTGTV